MPDKSQTKNSKGKLIELLDLPKDILLNYPNIYLQGNTRLHIENYKSIIEYSDCEAKISTEIGILKIKGNAIVVKSITSEEIIINGIINSIEFLL